jgi:hypothetical protein
MVSVLGTPWRWLALVRNRHGRTLVALHGQQKVKRLAVFIDCTRQRAPRALDADGGCV